MIHLADILNTTYSEVTGRNSCLVTRLPAPVGFCGGKHVCTKLLYGLEPNSRP